MKLEVKHRFFDKVECIFVEKEVDGKWFRHVLI